jgi:sugar lactone lactonase YvrE
VRTWTAVPATAARYAFGEGSRYDEEGGALEWVDLLDGRLHRAPLTDLDDVRTLVDLDQPLGAAAPLPDGGRLLLAGQGLSALSADGDVRALVTLEPDDCRMNDGVCDLQGRVWAGTTAYDEHEGGGALYRVDLDGTVVRVRDDVSIGNGPALSPDGRTLYLNDSGRSQTLAYDLDPDTGALTRERVLVTHDVPGDGLTVDDAGELWVALWSGGAVHRFSPEGRLTGRVEVDAAQVSSCCLAGGRLLITTVRARLEHPGPDDGRLFAADVGVMGPPVRPFLGALPTGRVVDESGGR